MPLLSSGTHRRWRRRCRPTSRPRSRASSATSTPRWGPARRPRLRRVARFASGCAPSATLARALQRLLAAAADRWEKEGAIARASSTRAGWPTALSRRARAAPRHAPALPARRPCRGDRRLRAVRAAPEGRARRAALGRDDRAAGHHRARRRHAAGAPVAVRAGQPAASAAPDRPPVRAGGAGALRGPRGAWSCCRARRALARAAAVGDSSSRTRRRAVDQGAAGRRRVAMRVDGATAARGVGRARGRAGRARRANWRCCCRRSACRRRARGRRSAALLQRRRGRRWPMRGLGLRAVVVDDLHCADDASLELLLGLVECERLPTCAGRLAHAPGRRRRRPGSRRGAVPRRHAPPDALALGPLELPQMSRAGRLARPARARRRARWPRALLRHSGGNPLFALETLRDMVSPGGAGARAGRRSCRSRAASPRWSSGALAQLSAAALKLARVAALAGADFDAELAAAVLDVASAGPGRALARTRSGAGRARRRLRARPHLRSHAGLGADPDRRTAAPAHRRAPARAQASGRRHRAALGRRRVLASGRRGLRCCSATGSGGLAAHARGRLLGACRGRLRARRRAARLRGALRRRAGAASSCAVSSARTP